tara:strand:- start:168 stop:332 length:165 start_codon:yes stop_codon:yes gene_type:complete
MVLLERVQRKRERLEKKTVCQRVLQKEVERRMRIVIREDHYLEVDEGGEDDEEE